MEPQTDYDATTKQLKKSTDDVVSDQLADVALKPPRKQKSSEPTDQNADATMKSPKIKTSKRTHQVADATTKL